MRRSAVFLLFLTLGVALALPSAAHAQEVPTPPMPPIAAPIPPIVWQLTASSSVGAIAEPGRYTVQFIPDGTVSIRADCNWVSGVWSGGNGALDISLGPSTLAECPPDSLGQPFVQALDGASSYVLDGMTLILTGSAGEMSFAPEFPAMA
jgi:heat shock protein HslJ